MQETQETWVQLLGWEDPLEEGIYYYYYYDYYYYYYYYYYSSILTWGIPWTEEPSGLQSIGSRD